MQAEKMTADQIEGALRALAGQEPPAALRDLTAVANRAVIELHKLAREQANAHKGAPDWGRWARLANAVRSSVLQIASVRDSLKALEASPPAAAQQPGEAP